MILYAHCQWPSMRRTLEHFVGDIRMGRSKDNRHLKPGYRWRPHCGRRTVCKCITCGKLVGVTFSERFAEGMCRACNGLGQVPKQGYSRRSPYCEASVVKVRIRAPAA